MNLIPYGSDSSDDEPEQVAVPPAGDSTAQRSSVKPSVLVIGAKKRKALPSLPGTYHSGPRDDPFRHQGRKRTRPYVEGDWDAHIYISVTVSAKLKQALGKIIADTERLHPSTRLHSFLKVKDERSDIEDTSKVLNHLNHDVSGDKAPAGRNGDMEQKEECLHVSLTHPLALRRSQITPFVDELSTRLQKAQTTTSGKPYGFKLSFAPEVKVYYNGKRTGGEGIGGRAFMALQVGSGSNQINEIVEKVIHPMLKTLHLPTYHANPEYHASFAWCLLEGDTADSNGTKEEYVDSAEVSSSFENGPVSQATIDAIKSKFKGQLMHCQPRGGWQIDHLGIRIGKMVKQLALG